jgi:Fe-S-cluster containining protein
VPADSRVRSRALPALPYSSARGSAAAEGAGIARPAHIERQGDAASGDPDSRCGVTHSTVPRVRPPGHAGCSLVRVVQMAVESLAEFDCQTCGACCVSPNTGDAYVALSDSEATRMTWAQLPVILQRQGGDPPEFLPKLGTKLDANAMNVCAAFGGVVRSTCFCSIYADRPQACRQFDVGGNACREARRKVGLAV